VVKSGAEGINGGSSAIPVGNGRGQLKNADGSAGTWMLAQQGLVIWTLLLLSIDDRSAEDIPLSVFQEKKNYLPALKTSIWGLLLL
jgi:hypothetical protein